MDYNWNEWKSAWDLEPGTTYLNHGSFGPSPTRVQAVREEWSRKLERNPMDFFVRKLGDQFDAACSELANFLNAPAENLIFVPNASAGMNIVANNVPLAAGDEVLINDHEYGSVLRLWRSVCRKVGAEVTPCRMPDQWNSPLDLVEALFERVTPRTKLIVVSHITSITATIFPVQQMIAQARQRGITICVDGPHAPGMIDVNLRQLDPDYYTASCHKWLSAPFGSGFLYVRSRHKQGLQPYLTSWGRNFMGQDPSWKDEFQWPGTFDPAAYFAVPEAIRFLKEVGLKRFREQTHALAQYARKQIEALTQLPALVPDDINWYGSMITLPFEVLPESDAHPSDSHPLQKWLWESHRIEIPIVRWRNQACVRVSCHLYNTPDDIDKLVAALQQSLEETA